MSFVTLQKRWLEERLIDTNLILLILFRSLSIQKASHIMINDSWLSSDYVDKLILKSL